LVSRLQAVDDAVLSLVASGTGGSIAPTVTGQPLDVREAPKSISDAAAYGFGRTFYVSGAIGGLGLLRLLGGILVAIAPLVAGLLLFEGTRGIFWGWLRTLFAIALGSLFVTVAGVLGALAFRCSGSARSPFCNTFCAV
jgi:type IV secretion system protein VirB6